MKIQQKLTFSFLGLSLLTGIVGGVAIYEEIENAQYLAIIEAEEVAKTIATFTTEEVGNASEITPELAEELQEYTMALHDFMQRDIEIIGRDGLIKTDVFPQHIGKVFKDDENGEVVQTIADGKTRFFKEISGDYPDGIRQIVVPIENKQNEIIAAIMFEYTPLYNEMIESSRPSMYILLGTTVACILLSLAGGYYISRSIYKPMRVVTDVAEQVTENQNFNLHAEVTSTDEISTLATALNELIDMVKVMLTEKEARALELEEINHKPILTQKQMIAQEKLAALGSLTAGIAHEIQNPLNFVKNFAELSVELTEELTEELEAGKEQLEPEFVEDIADIIETIKGNVSKIEHHSKRADKIVANMLMHSRSGKSELAAIDINELVSEAIALAYHGMRAKQSNFNLELESHYDDSIDTITVFPQDLNRALLNIVSNACYAVYERQLAEGSDFTSMLEVHTKNLDDKVEIRIRDNGTGMRPEVRDRIFDQFFTTKPTGEGTGLGLSMSYDIIVEQHQGFIDVKSELGVGTEFIIYLPKQIVIVVSGLGKG